MLKLLRPLFSNFTKNYYFILIFLAVSLPLSVFTTSLAEILLILNWIAEGNFNEKWNRLKSRKTPLIISGLFLIHIIWLINSADFKFAIHDLQIKLPVLLLPLVIGSSILINEKQLRSILLFFSAAVIASSICSTSVFLGIINYEIYDFREISLFISHIRFALMVNLSIFCLFYYGFGGDTIPLNRKIRIGLILAALWLSAFLIVLKSITGIFIFVFLVAVLGWIYSGRINQVAPKFIVRVLLITIPLIVSSFITNSISRFYYREEVNLSELDSLTQYGTPYNNYKDLSWVENGNYVWLNVCEEELRAEWNKVSELQYDSLDNMGQDLRFTLIRYLASKGLRKDKEGFSELDSIDISAIEDGVANYIFLNKYSLYPRVYQIIWEFDSYKRGNNPSGHSVTQRLAYLDASWYIVKNNFFFGVGTGDVQKEFNSYYSLSDNPLKKENRRRAHNQYLTFLITFGIFGFIFSMIALVLPVFIEKRWTDYLFMCFFIIGILSMLNEDTLETQTGVSFFMFFYVLLLFGRQKLEELPSSK